MGAGQWFWLLYVICVLFSGWAYYPYQRQHGGNLAIFVLIGLLGWHVFGPPLRGAALWTPILSLIG